MQQQRDRAEAWLVGVLHDDSEEDAAEKARAGVEPATNEKNSCLLCKILHKNTNQKSLF